MAAMVPTAAWLKVEGVLCDREVVECGGAELQDVVAS
jgi:hypothetical protein